MTTKNSEKYPIVSTRVTRKIRAALEQEKEQTGRSFGEIIRQALEGRAYDGDEYDRGYKEGEIDGMNTIIELARKSGVELFG